jgi:hypothetical protein
VDARTFTELPRKKHTYRSDNLGNGRGITWFLPPFVDDLSHPIYKGFLIFIPAMTAMSPGPELP